MGISAGGSFLPAEDYVVTGDWTFGSDVAITGDLTVTGTISDSGSSFGSPVITGTVTGGASYTAPTLTAITVTGTSTIGAGMTITAPAIVGATITGTVTIANGSTITTPILSGTVTGTYTLGGTPTLASAAGVPYVGGVAASYRLARVSMSLDGSNPTPWATGLTTVIAGTVSLVGSAAPGVGTSVLTPLINGTSLDVYAWKPTSNSDPTLIASTGTEVFYGVAIGT